MVEKSHTAGWWPELQAPFRTIGGKIADWIAPPSEASSDEGAYEIVLELPGVKEKDIDVTIKGDLLTVKGEKRSETEKKGKSFYFSERSYGYFQRSFRLPEDAVESGGNADISDGVLTITIPKAKPKESSAKKISVKKA